MTTDALPTPIRRILVIEDQPEVQTMLGEMLAQTFPCACCQLAERLDQAMQLGEQEWDLVLVDLRLPDGSGLDWIRHFRAAADSRARHPWVVVSTLFDDEDFVIDALRAGADGYLLKSDGMGVLSDTLQRLLRGEPPISSSIARKLLGYFHPPRATTVTVERNNAESASPLTEKEEQVLGLIGSGLSIKLAAERLFLSPHTVHSHIKSIYSKLGINTRAQAATEAARRGLL